MQLHPIELVRWTVARLADPSLRLASFIATAIVDSSHGMPACRRLDKLASDFNLAASGDAIHPPLPGSCPRACHVFRLVSMAEWVQ